MRKAIGSGKAVEEMSAALTRVNLVVIEAPKCKIQYYITYRFFCNSIEYIVDYTMILKAQIF